VDRRPTPIWYDVRPEQVQKLVAGGRVGASESEITYECELLAWTKDFIAGGCLDEARIVEGYEPKRLHSITLFRLKHIPQPVEKATALFLKRWHGIRELARQYALRIGGKEVSDLFEPSAIPDCAGSRGAVTVSLCVIVAADIACPATPEKLPAGALGLRAVFPEKRSRVYL